MKIICSIKKMHQVRRDMSKQGQSIGFVPTMGALHDGHLSLIRQARKDNHKVIVSIFVNPIQFAPQEDFKRYPRNLKIDAALCRKEGVDIIFYPGLKAFYPQGYRTYVKVEELSEVLCGKFRPGHFKGVTTVVTKLFNIIQPDIAYFGQKDAQQAIIISRLVRDLNMPISIKVMPTLRCRSGLALSSRNTYLSSAERKEAAVLFKALRLAQDLVRQGRKNSVEIIRQMKRLICKENSARIQYISIVDLKGLNPMPLVKERALVVLAAYIGKTRLIDNMVLTP